MNDKTEAITPQYTNADFREFAAVKHNELIQNQHYTLEKGKGESLTLLEQKVLLYVISQIKPTDTELHEQWFDIKTFCDICGFNTSGANYELLKETITKLKSRVMWLYTDEMETTVSWIDKATIYKRSGRIKIRLDEDLKPYLLMLQRNYTKIPLFNIIRMKSKYGIALYELLQSYSFMKRDIEFNIDYLKQYLDCENYENITNFKTKVLNPAMRDINTYSNIYCEYELIKCGRQYQKVIFHIKDLIKSSALADVEERIRRTYNVEKEINPNQIMIQDILQKQKEGETE